MKKLKQNYRMFYISAACLCFACIFPSALNCEGNAETLIICFFDKISELPVKDVRVYSIDSRGNFAWIGKSDVTGRISLSITENAYSEIFVSHSKYKSFEMIIDYFFKNQNKKEIKIPLSRKEGITVHINCSAADTMQSIPCDLTLNGNKVGESPAKIKVLEGYYNLKIIPYNSVDYKAVSLMHPFYENNQKIEFKIFPDIERNLFDSEFTGNETHFNKIMQTFSDNSMTFNNFKFFIKILSCIDEKNEITENFLESSLTGNPFYKKFINCYLGTYYFKIGAYDKAAGSFRDSINIRDAILKQVDLSSDQKDFFLFQSYRYRALCLTKVAEEWNDGLSSNRKILREAINAWEDCISIFRIYSGLEEKESIFSDYLETAEYKKSLLINLLNSKED